MDDERFMELAINKARKGIAAGQSPFGACIVRGHEIIACEHNQVWGEIDATAHAEVMAIRAACAQERSVKLLGTTIYSTTEPCPMCFAAIHWAGIERIVFGSSIPDARQAGFDELDISNQEMKRLGGSRIVLVEGVLANQARALFQEWMARGGKTY